MTTVSGAKGDSTSEPTTQSGNDLPLGSQPPQVPVVPSNVSGLQPDRFDGSNFKQWQQRIVAANNALLSDNTEFVSTKFQQYL
ncbi:hypothetical protein F2Q69_00016130 [Brassica cretica]|uniref:Uncharacterized protein n=1 Tax=Brassica cretica TaxID=69181 RepID=A0A8S9QF19_BRACR|nr:hypothetical protein F2Q69_00016130 [Brassica cretica]